MSVYWKGTVSFTVTATDPEGDRLHILVDGLPHTRATLGTTTGTETVTATFFWNSGVSDLGEHLLTFTAKDQHGAKNSRTTMIVVCDGSLDCLI